MGDMADFYNEVIERGFSVVRNNYNGKTFVESNIELMYGNWCKEPKFTILGDTSKFDDEEI